MDSKERQRLTHQMADAAIRHVELKLEGWNTKRSYTELLKFTTNVLEDIRAANDPRWHPDPPAKPKPDINKWGVG